MFTKQVSTILQSLQSPGNFYAKGSLEVFPPCLQVNKVGRISLPLLPIQADHLVQVAERAPYGKGYETVIDTDVRRTWQVNADQVNLSGKYWKNNLATIVRKVKSGLGVDCEVSAELYKLLVYDTGSFFVSHRDTEKAGGMFATLVIVLPSEYSGGELVVRHQQEEVTLDLQSQVLEEISFAAFYADCVHEVLPITDGCRLTLVYNLIRNNKKIPLPTPPSYYQAQLKVTELLNNWVHRLNTKIDNEPQKLIYLLEHEYSIAELKFDALKNKDAASADVLINAAEQAGCNLYLALISVEERGSAEHIGGGYYSRWGNDDDDDEFEIGEVFDHSETISKWRSPDDSQPELPALPFKEEEFCPPEAFDKMDTDDIEFQEATGNEGASFERRYHCAALVLWPQTHYLVIINQAGLTAALPVLAGFCQQWKNNKNEKSRQNAQTLASYLLTDWFPDHCEKSNSYVNREHIPVFLKCLDQLANAELINHFWLLVAEKGIYHKKDSQILAKISHRLPWSDLVSYTNATLVVSVIKTKEPCVALLTSLCNIQQDAGKRQQLSVSAKILLTALLEDSKYFAGQPIWQQQRAALNESDVVDIIVSFSLINTEIAEEVLDYILARPKIYDIDRILLPAALQITAATVSNELPAIVHLRQIVITHLQTRLDKLLQPPADWTRDNTNTCSCKDCDALNQFLMNSSQSQWHFKAAEARRQHVQYAITSNKTDIDFDTEKKSRPYSLVCTKNQASYQCLVDLSRSDKKALSRLKKGNSSD